MVHNHPSGDPTPSNEDIVRAAQPLGVTVDDHLIIGRRRHTGLRDLGRRSHSRTATSVIRLGAAPA